MKSIVALDYQGLTIPFRELCNMDNTRNPGDYGCYIQPRKKLAEDDDRSFSDYLRHVLRCHVRQIVSAQDRRQSMPRSGLDQAD